MILTLENFCSHANNAQSENVEFFKSQLASQFTKEYNYNADS